MPETQDMTEQQKEEIFKQLLSEKMRKAGAKGKKSRWSKLSKKQRSEWGRKMAEIKHNKEK